MIKAVGLIAISLCVASGPALAQDDGPPIGSRLGKRKDIHIEQDPREAVRASHRIAGCIYLKRSVDVRAALDSLDRSDARRRLASISSKGTCLNLRATDDVIAQQARFPVDIYRGILSEAALRQENLAASLTPIPRQPTYNAPWFQATGRPLAVDEMSACVADTNPAGVRTLLATVPEMSEEMRAISELSPSLGPCLTVGAKLNANRQSLRAALAEALYHRAVSPAAPAVAPR